MKKLILVSGDGGESPHCHLVHSIHLLSMAFVCSFPSLLPAILDDVLCLHCPIFPFACCLVIKCAQNYLVCSQCVLLILALILFFAATLLLIFVRYIDWIPLFVSWPLIGPSQQCNSGVRFEVRGIVRGMDLPLSSTMRFDTVIKHKAVTMRISDS